MPDKILSELRAGAVVFSLVAEDCIASGACLMNNKAMAKKLGCGITTVSTAMSKAQSLCYLEASYNAANERTVKLTERGWGQIENEVEKLATLFQNSDRGSFNILKEVFQYFERGSFNILKEVYQNFERGGAAQLALNQEIKSFKTLKTDETPNEKPKLAHAHGGGDSDSGVFVDDDNIINNIIIYTSLFADAHTPAQGAHTQGVHTQGAHPQGVPTPTHTHEGQQSEDEYHIHVGKLRIQRDDLSGYVKIRGIHYDLCGGFFVENHAKDFQSIELLKLAVRDWWKKTKPRIRDIRDVETRKTEFGDTLRAWMDEHPGKYPKGFYGDFYGYWTERDKKANRMRYEAETYWELGKRLATSWTIMGTRKFKDFNSNNNGQSKQGGRIDYAAANVKRAAYVDLETELARRAGKADEGGRGIVEGDFSVVE